MMGVHVEDSMLADVVAGTILHSRQIGMIGRLNMGSCQETRMSTPVDDDSALGNTAEVTAVVVWSRMPQSATEV